MVAGTRDKRRLIGVLGTAARVALGTALLGSVVEGHISGDFRPSPWALGLLGFPAATLAWHRWRTQRSPGRLEATAIASNWVLRREDEMGCALFEPVDGLEGRSRPRPDLGHPAQERLPPLSPGASPSPRRPR